MFQQPSVETIQIINTRQPFHDTEVHGCRARLSTFITDKERCPRAPTQTDDSNEDCERSSTRWRAYRELSRLKRAPLVALQPQAMVGYGVTKLPTLGQTMSGQEH